MAKTCQIDAKQPSPKTVGTSSTEKKTKFLFKFSVKALVSKPTIPEQNPTYFKSKSVVEAAYEEAKVGLLYLCEMHIILTSSNRLNISEVECSDRVKNILAYGQKVLDSDKVSLTPGPNVMDPCQVFLGSGQELIY
ncbi:hypothetical protein TorRG33x02_282400 [Trema orientale]|uniref:Uncharacterized protein n=1 Tax=Trema orientale TaxID=63057 RepID=A0A2P5CJK1_TREOI|nr:hypothetical protein TorRG33x02_282400 [Trema orientale]